MLSRNEADQTVFRVVFNHEEQYSIWPLDKEIPAGWTDAGKQGQKVDCLTYINEVWADMRLRTVREAMARQGS